MHQQNSINPQALRYTRDDVIVILGLRAGADVNRAIKSRDGFPEKLPGTSPPLWSKKAVDDWFRSDAGRRAITTEGAGEISPRITIQSPDELEAERDELNRRYGGQ